MEIEMQTHWVQRLNEKVSLQSCSLTNILHLMLFDPWSFLGIGFHWETSDCIVLAPSRTDSQKQRRCVCACALTPSHICTLTVDSTPGQTHTCTHSSHTYYPLPAGLSCCCVTTPPATVSFPTHPS